MRFTSTNKVSDKTWTESTHLELIAAVMKVEEEEEEMIRSASPVSGKRFPKWKKVANLLPPAFRDKISQNISAQGTLNRKDRQIYRCARVFDMILRTYRVYMMQRRSRCDSRGKPLKPGKRLKPPPMLTEPVCTMLQKREDLRNAASTGAGAVGLKSRERECRRSKRIGSRQRHDQKKQSEKKRNDPKKPSERTATPSLLTVNEYGESSQGSGRAKSMSTAMEQAQRTGFLLESEDFSGSSPGSEYNSEEALEDTDREEIPHFDNNVKQVVIPTNENDIGQVGLRQLCMGRWSAGFTPRSQSRSASESEHLAKRSNTEQVQAPEWDRQEPKIVMSNRARRKSSRKRSQRKWKMSKTLDTSGGRSGEHAHLGMNAISSSFLRKLDQEFSLLSSWVKNRVIPIQKAAVNEIIRSANPHFVTSRERSKRTVFDAGTNLLGHFDQLIHKSSRRMTDYQIRASFLNLRIRFADEFRKMSVELERISAQLIQEVLDDEW